MVTFEGRQAYVSIMRTLLSKRSIRTALALAILASQGFAQAATDPLTKLKASYEAAMLKTEKEYATTKENCRKGYPAALGTKEMLFQRAGNLDGVLAIRKEKERYQKEKAIPRDPPAGTDPQVQVLQAAYHKALDDAEIKHNKAVLYWTKLYLEKLETLTRNLTVAGKIDEALAARKEQERVRKDPVVTAAEFAMADAKTSTPPAEETVTPPAPEPATTAKTVSQCLTCNGTGRCGRCRGTGQSPHGFKGSRLAAKCVRCMGSGKCKTCNGTGWVGPDGRSAPAPVAEGAAPGEGESAPAEGAAKFLEGAAKLLRSLTPRAVDINKAWYDTRNHTGKLLQSNVQVMGVKRDRAVVSAGKTIGEGRRQPVWYPLIPANAQIAAKFKELRRGSRVTITYIFAQDRSRYLLDVKPAGGEGEHRRTDG